ncbi:MAG: hypothetical protein JWQ40_1587 [Segetibacter sp.]|nr:hypothetical protein [Segetibacter sp.]
MLKVFVKAESTRFGKIKTSFLRFLQIGEERIKNVIKSIITTKAITKIITSANSVDEVAAGSYCKS